MYLAEVMQLTKRALYVSIRQSLTLLVVERDYEFHLVIQETESGFMQTYRAATLKQIEQRARRLAEEFDERPYAADGWMVPSREMN